MSRGRQEEAWGRFSSLLATLVNVHPHKGGRAYKPGDFNPFVEDEETLEFNDANFDRIRKELGG